MSFVPVRDLRNHTAEVIERARSGERVIITVNGTPAATLTAVEQPKKLYLTKTELLALRPKVADLTLAADIAALTNETTDDLGPIR
jgi:prevent-host-death family protein